MIRVIAPAINDKELQKVFNYLKQKIFKKFDVDGDNSISFEEFRKELQYALPKQDSQFDPLQEKANVIDLKHDRK